MNTLGICLGASTIGLVALRPGPQGPEILWSRARSHEGNPRRGLREMLSEVDGLEGYRIAATGRKFRHYLAIDTISEPEAIEIATRWSLPADHPYRVVVSAGGETFIVYHLDDAGRIQGIHTGNKCASGTGEFFLQQLGRMELTVEEVGQMAMPEHSHEVSGRCSVFCKSDCTHALNKGVPKMEVVAGLARMMAGKVLELIKKLPAESVLLVGGCAANASMVHYLREAIPDLRIPDHHATYEALGAALWAYEKQTLPCPNIDKLFVEKATSLAFLRPLSEFRSMVRFEQRPRRVAEKDDHVIVGLDVGSTTTKGVVLRRRDKAILAADYLRTGGDPVGASRRVYASLAEQLTAPVIIEGLGVTGSGRQIAGLHAMTDGVINEIIAHATAAVHFDPEVDTIFEIGGQDAKYTHITNGVPSDYAMNEACSAGTGSFLEESAKESLGLDVTSIGPTAYEGQQPPNFNDQCAAFISSDIKRASQEGVSVPDIVAGLVYSICMNYANRVKGNRPVGRKVFMQGGVCYNEAIPAAMAALTGKEIIVPPEPGLMGAFGVALEVQRRIDQGLLESASFDLDELAAREVVHREPFICKGGKEKCDLKCEIARIEIAGQIYPFGGVCNRYDNLIHKRQTETTGLNLVVQRERRVFRDLAPEDGRPTVGLNRSFLINTYFPFFNRFFAELGYRVVLPDTVRQEGIDQRGAAFCYPVEIAHGYAADLIAKGPDFLCLPHLRGVPAAEEETSCTCVFVQGEPYYLPAAFDAFAPDKTLRPFLDFSLGYAANLKAFEEMAAKMGADRARVKAAVTAAEAEQAALSADLRRMGAEALAAVEANPQETAVILFGRPYNSFVSVANKGIPAKFATRGIRIIPFDMLDYDAQPIESDHNMYWGIGRQILKAAHIVKAHPQLFGAFITNFSCGPDSFVVGYFRDIMGRKPSLTLELDNHTADAGLETRIEAFLDVVQYYRHLSENEGITEKVSDFHIAEAVMERGRMGVRTSSGEWVPFNHPKVKAILPVLGEHATPLLAECLALSGLRAEALPPADEDALKVGRGSSSCKECLPLQTTLGTMLTYLRNRSDDEVTIYFMGDTNGPCRFGQYNVLSRRVIEKLQIPDAAVIALSSTNGYGGLGTGTTLAAWRAVVIGDVLDEIHATLLAGAVDRAAALETFAGEFEAIRKAVAKGWRTLSKQLTRSADVLATIPLRIPYEKMPKISLVGEIYVRRDPISLQGLVERLADRGFVVRTTQSSEWFKYIDWLTKNKIEAEPLSLGFWARHLTKEFFDKRIRNRMAPSGLYYHDGAKVEPVIDAGRHFVSPKLTGEGVLTVGAAFHEILHPSCGIISIGPFGCMPSRLAESILSEKFTTAQKRALDAGENGHAHSALLEGDRKLPFLAIETDGNAFPQVIEARLEAFCLQAQRLHDQMLAEVQ